LLSGSFMLLKGDRGRCVQIPPALFSLEWIDQQHAGFSMLALPPSWALKVLRVCVKGVNLHALDRRVRFPCAVVLEPGHKAEPELQLALVRAALEAGSARSTCTASATADSASLCRPRCSNCIAWLARVRARSGRKASGRARAKSRKVSVASVLASSASLCRPRCSNCIAWLARVRARSGRKASGRARAKSQ